MRWITTCYAAQHPAPAIMIRCHLSTLLGTKKLTISEVARLAQINRSTVTALYHETATRVELPAVNALCEVLGCTVGDLFEFRPDAEASDK